MRGDRIKGLFRWIGRQGRPGLWTVAVLAVGFHLVLGVHLLQKHEFMRFEPLCWEDPGLWTLERVRIRQNRKGIPKGRGM